ncbi:MAG: glycerophosphodiester phosphodiesterase family protein [Pseudomonadota bacterium]
MTGSPVNWIAHRGDPFRYPENSLAGYRSAIAAGAKALEADIHLSADGIPVLAHDDRLDRISGVAANLLELTWKQLQQIPACHPARFGRKFSAMRFASLDQFVELLESHPQVTAFIEIKRKSLYRFGRGRCLRAVMERIKPVQSRVCIISFDAALIDEVMHLNSDANGVCGGWVILEWSEECHQQAQALSPDYLFINIKRLPSGNDALWQGDWQWVLYNIDNAASRDRYLSRGFHLFETNHIASMMHRTAPDEAV